MSKAFTIGALARESGVNLETIRFYERSGLLPTPARSVSGYRHYQAIDVRRLRFIRRGRELGFSLGEIKALIELAGHPQSPCAEADRLVQEHLQAIEARIQDLQRMKAELAKLAGCDGEQAEHCRLLEALDSRDLGLGDGARGD
ncbi:MerR family DNA-binding protein [Pseudomonas sp. SA3-5]|uniref:MerR family DNA-binding protein n=1 Tax=Pseudomonas aestuarii TaxID=3018340 RepID=A0ABT4XJC8_9PSED|nr:MerR family DNA-binding protein [Pseudomonas aestuarii]MDA7088326.1 MerR family DNA-binding protein [Pseudomonas aestuarii]